MYVWKNAKGKSVTAPRVKVNRLTSKNNPSGLYLNKGTIQVGKGAHGTVNLYYNVGGRRKYALKQSNENMSHEIQLMRKLKKIVPDAIPTVYSNAKNKNLRTNYIPGGSLDSWIEKNNKYLTDEDMSLIIIQVLKILQRIYNVDPTFRHNDLHMGNLLVDDDANKPAPNATGVRIMLTDFGFSRDSEFKNPVFEGIPSNWSTTLMKEYGIYVGNDKMYDALTFLSSVLTRTKFTHVKRIIRRVLKGIKMVNGRLKMVNGRPKYGQKINYSFRDLISLFTPAKQNVNINASGLFKQNLKEFAKGKKISNLAALNLRSMFPNISDAQFLRNVGFIPKKPTKRVNLPKQFITPVRLRNKATLGVPVTRPSTSRMKNVFVGKRQKTEAEKLLTNLFGSPNNSPFNQKKFNTANLTKIRPVNVENYVKSKGQPESKAKAIIEGLVRSKRKEAWEKAQEMLKGQVKISRR